MVMIEGKASDHYARIWDYVAEIQRSNPGSTVQVGVNLNPDGKHYFYRFYVCFHALKTGWIAGCRRVIGLDGCFLKGQVKGQLLTPIGRDANNQVYPICWAVVDIENKQNWKWFLELLSEDVGVQEGGDLIVISDQHKGLLEAVKEVFPNAEHRQCVRHIYANFKKSYKGEEYKDLFWAAAGCTVEPEFISVMERLKAIDVGAYEYVMSHNPSSWSRAYFCQDRACEAFENGVSESFNAMIVDARKRPLLTMLEMIRLSVRERVSFMYNLQQMWEAPICPAIITKFETFGEHYRSWSVIPSDGGQNPEDFISPWFSSEKLKESYSTFLQPMNGSNLWPKTPYEKPLPPMSRRMPGRPTVNRKKHVSEKGDCRSRKRTVKCNNCQQFGHNKKSCKNPTKEPKPKPKKKIGRPSVEKIEGTSKRPRKQKKTKVPSAYSQAIADLRASGYISQEIEELMGTMDDFTQEPVQLRTMDDVIFVPETVAGTTMDDVTLEVEGIEETLMGDVTFVPETIALGSTGHNQ
ncbi:uncharacterized protein LOC111915798 [Lactuca sativa]|uniref:uncharacterized protein LOC111915798 n=1 Tax=Lactuca sativa TaxID=4236 RepID=UPI0022AF2323|nr:uncharacterized protein LOC111915798 [Lactuca sativa]